MSVLGESVRYTMVPNIIFDDYLPSLSPAEVNILFRICRETIGYQRKSAKIALSTFAKRNGITKPTVIKHLKSLGDRQLIEKNVETTPHSYGICEHILQGNGEVKEIDQGLIVSPQVDKKLNQESVKDFHPKKKPKNKQKESTTSTDEDLFEVIQEWNKTFDFKIDENDEELISSILELLNRYSVNQLKKAIYNRSKSDYYIKSVPYLRDKPYSFFTFPITVANDLNRKPKNLFTYKQMVDKVTRDNLDMNADFQRIEELKDENGYAMWEFLKPG